MSTEKTLPEGWHRGENAIARTFQLRGFNGAQQLAGMVAYIANQVGHHPSIEIHDYNQLTVTSTSHDAGGVTDNDVELARRINAVLAAAEGQ